MPLIYHVITGAIERMVDIRQYFQLTTLNLEASLLSFVSKATILAVKKQLKAQYTADPTNNNIFKISGALHLAQPGLMAGRQAGWLADEIQVNFKIFKVGCRSKYSTCRFV